MNNQTITTKNGNQYECTRVNNDINGNPRYVIHFLTIQNDYQSNELTKKAGLKRFHNKQYGGGYVFQSYNIQANCERFDEIFKK